MNLEISYDSWTELSNISHDVYLPVSGFMNEKDYRCVVDHMQLPAGQIWTLPITLEIPSGSADQIKGGEKISLTYQKDVVGEIEVNDFYRIDPTDLKKIFKTDDPSHPGVTFENSRSPFRIGGRVKLLKEITHDMESFVLSPKETKALFEKNGWKKIAAFQTRNPVHRAHEHLQRIALEVSDGLMIQPIVGWKKKGDFTNQAVLKSYELTKR
jgi:sulfate adenylyltransferase